MRARLILWPALLLAGSLATAVPASAQIFGGKRQDEAIVALQRQSAQLQAQAAAAASRIASLTQAQATTGAELTSVRKRADDLEATIRSMNGTVETLTGDLAQARRDLLAAQAENRGLVERLTRLETTQAQAAAQAAASQAAAQAQAAARPATPGDPAAAFASARALMQAGRFDEASAAFEAYADLHADQPNAAEANYLLGETLYVGENYGDAAQAYIVALKGWPKSSWAPDAVAKLAGALIALKQPADACNALGEFDRRYAASASAAQKARTQRARADAKCA